MAEDGGGWNYLNKDIYLKSLIVICGTILAAIIAPFFTPGVWSGLSAFAIILVLGFYNAEWLTSLL